MTFDPNSQDSLFSKILTELRVLGENVADMSMKVDEANIRLSVHGAKSDERDGRIDRIETTVDTVKKDVTALKMGKLWAVGWIAGASFIIVIFFNLLWTAAKAVFKI